MDELFDRVSLEGAWHVREIGTGRAAGGYEDAPVALASVGKVPLVLALQRLADSGEVDLGQLVELRPDGRSAGTTGISAMQDSVTVSLRDAAYLALTISDNAAADALWDATTEDAIAAELAALGLGAIRLRQPMRSLYDAKTAEIHMGRDEGRHTDWRCLDLDQTNHATPEVLTRMLELIWTDQAASAASCAYLRSLMSRQVWHERLARAFPAVDIEVSGKTGTFLTLRHEIGVVAYPDGQRYAVAVLTHSQTALHDHRADHAIGEVARRAIAGLRRGHSSRS
jgi:beta-lactamase class A